MTCLANFAQDDDGDIWNLLRMMKEDGDPIVQETESLDCAFDKLMPSLNSRPYIKSKERQANNVDKECTKCDYCNSTKIILHESNYICDSCGTVLSRFIDSSAEWRFYGYDDNKHSDPTRCGLPTNELLPESSLGVMIGYGANESHDIRIMRKYHMWNSMTYKERSLYNIFDTLTLNAVNNGIPKSIVDEAKMLYKKISEIKISRGENRNGLIASSIYMSCKNNKVPRSTKEIARIFNLKVTTMTKGCKKFQELMKINTMSTTAEDFISRFCSKLNLDKNMREICKQVVKKAEELGIVSENTPPSIAAGSIYLCNVICMMGLSKKELSDACEISQVTISKCYKKLYTNRAHLFPKDMIKQYNIK
jgi:transcription initiation factor TFIIB